MKQPRAPTGGGPSAAGEIFLTQDVSTLSIHSGKERIQTWQLVRMPEPAPAGEQQKLPDAPKSPPPLTKTVKAE